MVSAASLGHTDLLSRQAVLNQQGRTNMNRAISLVLIVVGIALIVFGVSAMDSFSSDVSRFFTGTPTDKAVWMLIAGIASAVVGLSGVAFFRTKE